MKAFEFVERLKNTPLGKRIMRDVESSERASRERAALVAELKTLAKEREQLPELAAEEARIVNESVDTVLQLHREACAIQVRRMDLDQRTQGPADSIRRQLRETSDARLSGSLCDQLGEACRHIVSHGSAFLDSPSSQRMQEWARNTRTSGTSHPGIEDELRRIEDQVALAKESARVEAALQKATSRLEALQLEALTPEEVGAELTSLVAALPKKCPCGQLFKFAVPDPTEAREVAA